MPIQYTAKNSTLIDFEKIKRLIIDEMKAVDKIIINELDSDVVLINQIGRYIISNGGKRLRPMLLILVAKALGKCNDHHLTLAATVEFIHIATLLHDDVIDKSKLRRGKDSANVIWGNEASILTGDYLYSNAFEMMISTNSMRVMRIFSTTTTAIAEGEILQLLNCNNPDTTEEKYMDVISRKTAILFSATAQLAAVVSGVNSTTEEALAVYGHQIGIAFQLIDDILDYKASMQDLGKNLGDDLSDKKFTLPLIHAIAHSTESEKNTITNKLNQDSPDLFDTVYDIVITTKSLEYTEKLAIEATQKAIKALSVLEDSDFKNALVALAQFVVQRDY